MLDPDLQKHLENIEAELSLLRKEQSKMTPPHFLKGIFYGAGYIVGAVLIIIIIGWILNIIGVIPAFNDQVELFRKALERIGAPVK
jgi:hypothetical protein